MRRGPTPLQWSVLSWGFMGLVGIPVLVLLDPLGGWRWQPHNAVYDQMIVSIYVAIGLCSLAVVRDPVRHAAFLWFVVLSSLLHGGVMLFHAATHPVHAGHLAGDVWILAGGAALALPLWRALGGGGAG